MSPYGILLALTSLVIAAAQSATSQLNWTALLDAQLGELPSTYIANVVIISGINNMLAVNNISSPSMSTRDGTGPVSTNGTRDTSSKKPFMTAGDQLGGLFGSYTTSVIMDREKGFLKASCDALTSRLGAIAGQAVNKGMRKEIATNANSTNSGNDKSTASESGFWQDFGTEMTSTTTSTMVSKTLAKKLCNDWLEDPIESLDKALKDEFKDLMDSKNSRVVKAMDRLIKRYAPRLLEDSLRDSGVQAEQAEQFADELMDKVNLVDCGEEEAIRDLQEELGRQTSEITEQLASDQPLQAFSTALVQLANVPALTNAAMGYRTITSSLHAVEEMMARMA
ncbi:hypothetical protein K491DRAFT_437416 [Lophiostoma macrostomum CBS 122681]|uniref:Secreted protein n=1 Tax=Lophiostoma macrostomum CBS 122681 TaxID=1314788 RepID=A0A6A6T5N9_9PLEO|nr:hypothetical protein K491DRAFT_437416 [Lophiostoma macrostomum CBS 122681]